MARMNPWLSVVKASTIAAVLAASSSAGAAASSQAEGKASAGELPYAVKFKTGANKFLKGDDITITEVRGTAETIAPGNIYCVKGTYKLMSHEKAMLAAYITVFNSSDDGGPSLQVQHAYVNKGEGTFTLYLPMFVEGNPHISFYAEREGMGGRYFGTGKYLLKKWWGTQDSEPDTAESLREELTRLEARIKVLENAAN